jgi:predicted DNA-binding transcriptional regulator AlpA
MHANAIEWLDLTQAEKQYPYSRRQFWYWISEGQLPVYRPTKRKIILKRSDIDRFLESKRVVANLDRIVTETLAELGVEK